jgi:hypothetical protein
MRTTAPNGRNLICALDIRGSGPRVSVEMPMGAKKNVWLHNRRSHVMVNVPALVIAQGFGDGDAVIAAIHRHVMLVAVLADKLK